MVKIVVLGICLVLSSAVFADDGSVQNVEEEEKTCNCAGPECKCCVDFNLTYVDLGGPGCVRMKFLSKDEGLMVNVSYGDRQLHGDQIKAGGPSMTCMDILLDLAQMCANFSGIETTSDGMKACASLVPSLLGDPQEGFQLGCFVMGSQGMRLINTTLAEFALPPEGTTVNEESESSSVSPPNNEDALIAAVNESAEEGIAWFTSFLGFSFGKSENQTSTPAPAPAPNQRFLKTTN